MVSALSSGEAARAERMRALAARRLFATGAVDEVHVYGNVVTVTLARGHGPEGLRDIIEGLYTNYREGVTPAIP